MCFIDYAGGLLTDLKWVVGKIGTDHAISINPDIEVGFDLDSKTIE